VQAAATEQLPWATSERDWATAVAFPAGRGADRVGSPIAGRVVRCGSGRPIASGGAPLSGESAPVETAPSRRVAADAPTFRAVQSDNLISCPK